MSHDLLWTLTVFIIVCFVGFLDISDQFCLYLNINLLIKTSKRKQQ